jgi:hypothetical protein
MGVIYLWNRIGIENMEDLCEMIGVFDEKFRRENTLSCHLGYGESNDGMWELEQRWKYWSSCGADLL